MMNRRWASAFWATAALTATLVVTVASVGAVPAEAQTSTTSTTSTTSAAGGSINPGARSAAEAAISARLTDLNTRVTLINSTPAITPGDRSALLTEIGKTVAGLQQLAATIKGETNGSAFRTEAQDIYTEYRVYALVIPQVHLVRAADTLTTVAVPDLKELQTALQNQIDTVQKQGRDASSTAAPMAALSQEITTIGTTLSGLSATVLGFTPAEWNANHSLLMSSRQAVGTAYTDSLAAMKDAQKVLGDLQ